MSDELKFALREREYVDRVNASRAWGNMYTSDEPLTLGSTERLPPPIDTKDIEEKIKRIRIRDWALWWIEKSETELMK